VEEQPPHQQPSLHRKRGNPLPSVEEQTPYQQPSPPLGERDLGGEGDGEGQSSTGEGAEIPPR